MEPHALALWDNAARLALPLWLKAWLLVLVLTFLGSLFFVRRHPGARFVFAGFVLSHALVAAIELGDLAVLRTGLVSLTHVIGWLPAAVLLWRDRPPGSGSRYARWRIAMLAVLAVALTFDLRDAGMYLYYQITGHPVLAAS